MKTCRQENETVKVAVKTAAVVDRHAEYAVIGPALATVGLWAVAVGAAAGEVVRAGVVEDSGERTGAGALVTAGPTVDVGPGSGLGEPPAEGVNAAAGG
ncbi:hypothetical protein GCM10023263_03360 [Phytohabitans rumicis]